MLTAAQHQARSQGLGGSDVAAALGLNPYQTRLELYFDKIGERIERPFTQRMHFGHQLEQVVADEYARRTGVRLRKRHQTLKHPKHPFMLAHVDRTLDKRKKILECKTADKWAARDDQWGKGNQYDDEGNLITVDDQVPEYYLMQVAHYMAVLDKDQADLAVLIGGNDFRVYTIDRDAELEAALIQLERSFWEEHVLARKPPPPCNERDLLRLFPSSEGKRLKASEAIESRVQTLNRVRAQIKELESDKAQYEFELKSYLGGFEVLEGAAGDPLVTWKTSKPSQRFDEKAFAAAHPELYQRFRCERPGSRRFLVK